MDENHFMRGLKHNAHEYIINNWLLNNYSDKFPNYVINYSCLNICQALINNNTERQTA